MLKKKKSADENGKVVETTGAGAGGDKKSQELVRLIGRIEVVHERGRFVLIRATSRARLQPGTRLEARTGSGITIPLTVSPERSRRFVVADFTEGTPVVEMPVFQVAGSGGLAPSLLEPPPL